MTSADEHIKKVKELLGEIDDAIDAGIETRPVILGFSCSECSCQLLELYLHKMDKISVGKQKKHNWFKPPQNGQKQEPMAERKLAVDFPLKAKIYSIIYEIEGLREQLIYGKPGKTQIAEVLEAFNKLKGVILPELKKLGVEI